MTDGLNQCNFIGNLGDDPELKTLQSGSAVMNFSLAVNSSYLDRDNTRQERTEWVKCVVWGKRAEGLAKHLSKGDRLFVTGELRTDVVEDRDGGEKKYFTKINVSDVTFCGSKRDGGGGDRDDRGRGNDRRDDRRDERRDTRGSERRDSRDPRGDSRGSDRRDDRRDDRGSGASGSGRRNDPPRPPPQEDFGGGYADDSDIPF